MSKRFAIVLAVLLAASLAACSQASDAMPGVGDPVAMLPALPGPEACGCRGQQAAERCVHRRAAHREAERCHRRRR